MEYHTLVILLLAFSVRAGKITLNPPAGEIVGFEEYWGKILVRKFRGIPYAEPPIGDRRFRAPEPRKSKFQKPFDASRFGSACIQNAMGFIMMSTKETMNQTMSEDCLTLNVYAPTGGKPNKAVMVWIYGGGFLAGVSSSYDATKMAAFGDVIVVTLNYRVGAFGFFTTGDAAASGNYGLLDQQLAFKWVQTNIRTFGGDPEKVTIFGESAGGSSVTWHTFAPSNYNLFKRVIAQSGVAACPWAYPDPKVTKKHWDEVINKLGCSNRGSDSKVIVECLRKVPATRFGHGSNMDWPYKVDPMQPTPAGPRVDHRFITASPNCELRGRRPQDQLIFKSVDLLLGTNKFEGEPLFGGFHFQWLNQTGENVYKGASKKPFQMLGKKWGGLSDEAIMKLWPQYSQSSGKITGKELLEFLGDASYYTHTVKFALSHADTHRTTYLYSFLPAPSKMAGGLRNDLPIPLPVSPYVKGYAIHMDDVAYLFGRATWDNLQDKLAPGEKELSDAMIRYWTNFAKTGNPNKPATVPQYWEPHINQDEKKLFMQLNIKNKALDLRTTDPFRSQYMQRWNNIRPRLQNLCYQISSATSTSTSLGTFITMALLLVSALRLPQGN